ncbi:MAG: hypothetical protein CMC43_06675 [Flavobacteriaceae bacterium]|nr:hypothetical protein [Flavobacteriaceae bacterium]|tara:strand:- start:366 stop:797 length:432 start_codon:yes stop_codon:yes gene_type:complete
MANYKKSWHMEVGINNVPSYQVSGTPFASGAIDARGMDGAGATKVPFPQVTRWVTVVNHGGTDVKVGFSKNGVEGNQYFRVHASGSAPGSGQSPSSGRLELKVSELWLSGSGNVDVVAGLTSIAPARLNTDSGTSWSGSVGVG